MFLLAFGIGVLSSAMDHTFPEVILGEQYVAMTLENIESGDPMAVYKQRGEFGMFVGITLNNLMVAFLTFVVGAFYMIGSIAILVRNAIMVGAFQYFFIEKGLFWESFLTIWIHGTLEISAIVIAGAAGITMGRGLAFPGTLTRAQSFQKSARRGIKIMMGVVPIFIIAGFFEGFLTRYTEAPNLLRGIFILTCLLFVLGYFVWYPMRVGRKLRPHSEDDYKVAPSRPFAINFYEIKSSAEIFSDLFQLYKKHLPSIIRASALAAAGFCLVVFLASESKPSEMFGYPFSLFTPNVILGQFFAWETPVILGVNLLAIAYVGGQVYPKVVQEAQNSKPTPFNWQVLLLNTFKVLVAAMSMYFVLWLGPFLTFLGILIVFPFLLLWGAVMFSESKGVLTSLNRAFILGRKGYSKMFGLFFILTLLSILFLGIVDSSVMWLFIGLIEWVVNFDQAIMDEISIVLLTGIVLFTVYLIYSFFVVGFGLIYYSLVETEDAISLNQSIDNLGIKQKIKGLERE